MFSFRRQLDLTAVWKCWNTYGWVCIVDFGKNSTI